MNALKLIFYSVLLSLLVSGFQLKAQEFQVVGNDIGITSLTQSELVSIFKPKNNRWENNRPVILVLPGASSEINQQVSNQIYAKSFVAVQKYWLSLVFQGRFNAPYFFNTDEETISFIQKTPGAIGFVSPNTPVPDRLLIKIR